MRKLYDILTEGILDTDKDIVRSTELYTRYEIFLQYFGDILWKKSPYSYSPGVGTIVFEFNRQIQLGTADQMYSEVDARLIRYFRRLERVYNKTYKISWASKYVTAGVIYYLNMKEGSKNNVIEFRVRNISDNRRIDIVWPKNFVFMSPDVNEGILDTDIDIVDKTKQAIAPSVILKTLRDVFGRFIDDKAHPNNEYLGSLNDDILDYFNSTKDPLAELKKYIGKFRREINKIEGFKASTKKALDVGYKLKHIVFRTIIEYKDSDVRSFYGLSFGVRYDTQRTFPFILTVTVISIDGDLIELENRSNILKGK